MPTQITHGIHLRLYSRAFIVADAKKASRVVFVNADICMGTQIMKMQVWGDLRHKLPMPVGGVGHNVCLTFMWA